MDFTISELVIPTSIDAPEAADFIEMTNVRNEVEAETVGNYDLAFEAEELLPRYQRQRWEPKRVFVARVKGRIVARAVYETNPPEDHSTTAWVVIDVLPDFRRRGIGGALFDHLLSIARGDGSTVMQTTAAQKPAVGAVLEAPTGFGAVPRDADSTRFLLARDFTLEQVERMSRLDLPVDPTRLATLLTTAQAAAGPDYRMVTWIGRTPEQRLESIALLRTRMGTDAPSAGMEADESVWSAERVRDEDDKDEASPRTMLTALVEHVPTGTAAGFTELTVPAAVGRPVAQGDTIVLTEHRGHRLGMLLKLTNIAQLAEEMPGHPSITTYNAEENRPMLSVNESIGFVAWANEGAWKRVL
ncbi:MAG: GNAT family N-acetyltransferase [Microbacteriaceae bacterium]